MPLADDSSCGVGCAPRTRLEEAVLRAADDPARGERLVTVTGTSAEAGDGGPVGCGNRADGRIAPLRPMTLEGIAGKNPVSHVGKLYNLAARRLAGDLVARLEDAAEARCSRVSRIGRSITEPQLVGIRLRTVEGVAVGWLEAAVREIVGERLAALPHTGRRAIDGSAAAE